MRPDIDEKLRMLLPVMGAKKVMQFRKLYYFETDPREKREIEMMIDMKISQLVKTDTEDRIILPPPPQEICQGEVSIGEVEYLDKKLYPFNLNLSDINRHMFVAGSTGSGKTTFALNLIRKLHSSKIPILIIDWETSYRHLVKDFPDFEVFTVGRDIHPIHINILDVPPGITKAEYTKSLISLIADDFLSGAGSDTMFLQYITTAFEELQKPTFEDLKQIILREIQKDMKGRGKLSGRAGLWKETVQRIVQFLAIGASANVLGNKTHFPLEKLFNKNIVLEFGGIKSPRDRKFIIHTVLNWMSLWTQSQGIFQDKLTNVILMEEFHNMTLKGNEDNMISTAFREIRKYGVGLIAIDQVPSEIPNAIFANTNTKICFSLSTNQDITSMAKAMNLQFDKARYLGMLKTGQAIINVKQRSPDAFVIKPPFIKQSGNIWDEELRELMDKFSLERGEIPPSIDESGSFQSSQSNDNSFPLLDQKLDPLEKVVLQSIIERPLDGVDERTKKLGFHPSQMSNLHASLEQKGIIKTITIDRKKLFELTSHGKETALDLGISIPKKESRGGLEHDYWITQTVQSLRKLEFQPVLEFGGIDISDLSSGLAIEIETGKSNIRSNLLKLENSRELSGQGHYMLATNKPALIKILELAKDHPTIKVLYIKDFLKLTREEILQIFNSNSSK